MTLARTLLIAVPLSALLAAGCGGDGAGLATRPAAPAVTEVTTPTGIVMVAIPAGEFVMGTSDGERDEQPTRTVRISAFHMDKFEVTQQAFEALMGRNPAKFKGPDHPVERVSWLSAVTYCNARSLREGLTPCYDLTTLACDYAADGYRLPTEAEWEYACRAGTTTDYSFGSDPRGLSGAARFKDNAGKTTHPVGQQQPNPWGLHDLHGNVMEWCNDYYAEDAYTAGDATDPRGPTAGDERVLRGGSWQTSADGCRSAARSSETPAFADACFGSEAYGFRCVRRAKAGESASGKRP